jgi:hypothetical protein
LGRRAALRAAFGREGQHSWSLSGELWEGKHACKLIGKKINDFRLMTLQYSSLFGFAYIEFKGYSHY